MSRTKVNAAGTSEIPTTSSSEHSEPLHVKYRPKTFKDVLGQDVVVDSIISALKAKARQHAWMFTGGAGTGKTTLSRILADEFEVSAANIIEVNAAVTTGVDDIRTLLGPLRYQGFGTAPNKAIIMDECHRLSKQAWDAMLKDVEEAPEHIYWFFCTTEDGKVPKTIMTRCQAYSLRPVKYDVIMDLLEDVCDAEKLDVPGKILGMVAQACEGSPRQALTMLAKVQGCTDERDAEDLLESATENAEVIELCQMLIRGELSWGRMVDTLQGLPEISPESVRIIITTYMAACAMRAKGDKEVMRILDIMAAFSKPCNPTDKMAPILLAFGNYIFD